MLDIMKAVNNDLTNGMFGIMFLLGFWIIMFVSFKTRVFSKQAFAASSFITMMLAFMMAALGLIPDILVFFPIALSVIGVVILIVSPN